MQRLNPHERKTPVIAVRDGKLLSNAGLIFIDSNVA